MNIDVTGSSISGFVVRWDTLPAGSEHLRTADLGPFHTHRRALDDAPIGPLHMDGDVIGWANATNDRLGLFISGGATTLPEGTGYQASGEWRNIDGRWVLRGIEIIDTHSLHGITPGWWPGENPTNNKDTE